MSNLNIKTGIDTIASENSIIPTGALMMKALAPTALSNYDTDAKCLAAGYIPCDGREVSRTTYANLFNTLVFSINISVNVVQDTIAYAGYDTSIWNGYEKISFSSTNTLPSPLTANTIYYPVNISGSGIKLSTTIGGSAINITSGGIGTHTMKVIFAGSIGDGSTTFTVPDLRTSRRYLYGQIYGTTTSALKIPAFSWNTTNTVTHTHEVSSINIETLSTNNVAGSHTHSVYSNFNNDSSSHSHYLSHNMPAQTTGQALGTTLTKADGTGTAAGAAHQHTAGPLNISGNTGAAGGGHSHSVTSTTTDSYSEPTHTHTLSAPYIQVATPSSLEIPYVNMLYFIKI